MKKKKFFRISRWMCAFIVLALAFLAVGLGTLGSTHTAGKAFRLSTQGQYENEPPAVIVELKDPGHGEEDHKHKDLYLRYIYVNIGAVYADYGETATLRIWRGTSDTNTDYVNYVDLHIANLYKTQDDGETNAQVFQDDIQNWIRIDMKDQDIAKSSLRISSYSFYKLTAQNHDILINEIVFVGNETDSSTKLNYVGEPVLLNAKIAEVSYTMIPKKHANETKEERLERASAILDNQYMPSLSQSSYYRFGAEEILTAMTVSEMRMGSDYVPNVVYHMEETYNSFGLDLLFIGTGIFGLSPFGLRFMPFLASFGILVFGFFFVRKLFKSEKAGLIFAVLYALCGMSFSLAHLGTPLMIGIFFFVASLYFAYRFFDDGMKKANFLSAVPLLLSGLFAAAAICSNGVFVVPVLGIVALFAAGVVRQRRAMRVELDAAIEEAEREETSTQPAVEGEPAVSFGKAKVAKVINETRYKTAVSIGTFGAFLVFGALLISVLAVLPLYNTFVKFYDNPAAPSQNIFYFAWRAFAGGFAGNTTAGNEVAVPSAWSLFYETFHGSGDTYAVTMAGSLVAVAAILAGVAGAVYCIVRLIKNMNAPAFKKELVTTLILFIGIACSLITASFASRGIAFVFLAYFFLFAFAARAAKDLMNEKSEDGTEIKRKSLARKLLVFIPCITLLVAVFLLFAVFTFSVPLPAAFMTKLF